MTNSEENFAGGGRSDCGNYERTPLDVWFTVLTSERARSSNAVSK
jgi:hypothetical protein